MDENKPVKQAPINIWYDKKYGLWVNPTGIEVTECNGIYTIYIPGFTRSKNLKHDSLQQALKVATRFAIKRYKMNPHWYPHITLDTRTPEQKAADAKRIKELQDCFGEMDAEETPERDNAAPETP